MSAHSRIYLAVDLGASSGRLVAGVLAGDRLTLEEVHRFENRAVFANDHAYWDLLGLWQQTLNGLQAAGAAFGERVCSVGVDTWGVDFGLLGPGDELLGNPYCYRDSRTNGMLEAAFSTVRREDIFAETGLQFMQFNTLYQLLALQAQNPRLLDAAESFLMIPDLFHWLLTGEKVNEQTNASTTQFYNPVGNAWALSLLQRFGLPTRILRELLPPGTSLGGLRHSVATETGLKKVRVVLPGTHDTASAVMAVPAASQPSRSPEWCYISSGTWSLMGVEVPAPVINDKCRDLNFTNEGGVAGTTRLLKNIAGLWLVQECRRIWRAEGRDSDWDQLVARAAAAAPLRSLINPDASEFIAPANMPATILQACRDSGQPIPGDDGAVIRSILESLALRYRMVLNSLEELAGGKIETIHIVGGGTQNRLLCQMAADACNRRVVAGPVEATAIGNIMMQVLAAGEVSSVAQARELVRNSFDVSEYEPHDPQPWNEAFSRFVKLV